MHINYNESYGHALAYVLNNPGGHDIYNFDRPLPWSLLLYT